MSTQSTPLDYLREVTKLNYGGDFQQFDQRVISTLNPESKDSLRKRLEKIIHDCDSSSLRFPTSSVPVELFLVKDCDFMTGKPRGYVEKTVMVDSRQAVRISASKFLTWLAEQTPTYVANGKFLIDGFDPTEPFRQYVPN